MGEQFGLSDGSSCCQSVLASIHGSHFGLPGLSLKCLQVWVLSNNGSWVPSGEVLWDGLSTLFHSLLQSSPDLVFTPLISQDGGLTSITMDMITTSSTVTHQFCHQKIQTHQRCESRHESGQWIHI